MLTLLLMPPQTLLGRLRHQKATYSMQEWLDHGEQAAKFRYHSVHAHTRQDCNAAFSSNLCWFHSMMMLQEQCLQLSPHPEPNLAA